MKISKSKEKPLGKFELIAIALGGMIGGGIFSILGVSVQIVGSGAPIAILFGGLLAFVAAYSYSKLASYYKDEGATYSFFKKTFPQQKFAISVIGWLIVFGYISTLALYAFTFSSYLSSLFSNGNPQIAQLFAFLIIAFFAGVNLISVNGMGKIEDIMVYTKVAILLIVSGLFLRNGSHADVIASLPSTFSLGGIITVAAITFVAFEGFQLVIHAYNEAESPDKNVPSSIYWAIGGTTFIYFVLSLGAIFTIPTHLLIRDKEFALAAGASDILGPLGYGIVITGALLATSSAINGTLFGASRLMAVIANDGVLPRIFSRRSRGHIPHFSIIAMSLLAFIFILTGGLQLIIEFGSVTFIVVSFLMALANFQIREKTNSHTVITIFSMILLGTAAALILAYEAKTDLNQLLYILGVYFIIALLAKLYSIRFQPPTS